MNSAKQIKRYYSWQPIWSTDNRDQAVALELALYKVKINARLKTEGASHLVEVPWVHAKLAAELAEAFALDAFDYPQEMPVRKKWKSYDRYQPARFRHRSSKAVLILGFVVFLLIVVRMAYNAGIFN